MHDSADEERLPLHASEIDLMRSEVTQKFIANVEHKVDHRRVLAQLVEVPMCNNATVYRQPFKVLA